MKERSLFNNEKGLYNFSYEHDACGVGMLVNIHGGKSHEIVESALKVLENMQHRGAEGRITKPVMALVSCFRYLMNLFCCKVFRFPKRESTEQDFFSYRRKTNYRM